MSIFGLDFVAYTLHHSKGTKLQTFWKQHLRQNFTLIYSISSFIRAANRRKKWLLLQTGKFDNKTETPPIQSIIWLRFASKRSCQRTLTCTQAQGFLSIKEGENMGGGVLVLRLFGWVV